MFEQIQKLTASRPSFKQAPNKCEGEGGCGVIGIAATEKIEGRHLLPALIRMCNRGNGKGGGIAAVGMRADDWGVSQETLDSHYLLAIGYLDLSCRKEVENLFVNPIFSITHSVEVPHLDDYRLLPNVEVPPPHVVVYFVRVRKQLLETFRDQHKLHQLSETALEDEVVFQNSQKLNRHFYSAIQDKRAFVLSHGKNLLVLKMVGYADDVIRYYKLENFAAHVWIGHHRYPTKGRVWHPGGAHPFIGLSEALVHNGDFANYSSMCEYLAERNLHPFFLTDTEVAALIFDLLYRTYEYPLEYVIEALAPTTERDFSLLPEKRKLIYQHLQNTHIHGSPDGPWFFLIAQSEHRKNLSYRLIGITDTSMLRPQVFALQHGKMSIGLSGSEKQAIDAVLESLASENRAWNCADLYWSARGGSYTDGGAFLFDVQRDPNGKFELICKNKFGEEIQVPTYKPYHLNQSLKRIHEQYEALSFDQLKKKIEHADYTEFEKLLSHIVSQADPKISFSLLTKLLDFHYPMNKMRQSVCLSMCNQALDLLIDSLKQHATSEYVLVSIENPEPQNENAEQTIVLDAKGFPADGKNSLARKIVDLYQNGFKKFIIMRCQGQRFIGNGLGPNSKGVEIDVYGSSGDYLGSGLDGATIRVHGSGQDQIGQILKTGLLVIYGDLGQTFMYGAKGGEAYILGNAAGRPLINAVGNPRVVINGTCLDYLAESFMAGSALKGGGFVIINAIQFDDSGNLIELETPYPGNNLFSLASGGAIYIRDPGNKISKDQLNGGEISQLFYSDWELILPYLEKNAALFNIPVSRLLHYEGKNLNFHFVYRKIYPAPVRILQEEEAWVKGQDET